MNNNNKNINVCTSEEILGCFSGGHLFFSIKNTFTYFVWCGGVCVCVDLKEVDSFHHVGLEARTQFVQA